MTSVRVPRQLMEDDPAVLAPLAGLAVVDDTDPGVSRRRCGRGFRYIDPDGSTVRAPARDHYVALAVPPAWDDVWLSPVVIGHLQATGRDAEGRKQYRYHESFRALRDRQKFDRMGHFLRALTRLRTMIGDGLDAPVGTEAHAVAAALRVVDSGLVRVGNPRSAASGHFGATTLEVDHVDLGDEVVRISFVGKGAVARDVELTDAETIDAVRRLTERGRRQRDGDEPLFWYESDDGERRGLQASDLNDAMRSCVGPAFTVKDFRTWGGSRVALEARAAGATVLEAVDEAASALGNTRAVARASYVHPHVLDASDDEIGAVWQGCRSSELVGRGDRALDRLLGARPTLFARL